jgi:retron-type reverse transcriptase
VSEKFNIPDISIFEVGKHISGIKNSKSMGPDTLTSRLLKLSEPYIADSLTYICNLCIQKSYFPFTFKTAKVIPIPKAKDMSDLNNYRPISILSTVSKILERHVHKHLLQYLESKSLVNNSQSGFRPHHSCQTALTKLTSTWLTSINDSKLTGAVFLDFRKAFDLVDHNILLKKLPI